MQHVRKIGGTRIARSDGREAVKGGPRSQCVCVGRWRPTGPVQVPTGIPRSTCEKQKARGKDRRRAQRRLALRMRSRRRLGATCARTERGGAGPTGMGHGAERVGDPYKVLPALVNCARMKRQKILGL